MELPNLEALVVLANFVSTYLFYILIIVIPVAFVIILKSLTKKKDYSSRIIEIKEAPLEINNLMRDAVKRNVIRALRKERKYMTAISTEINENAPRLRYHLKQLEKANLLKSFKLARETYFTLTKKGQWCLDAIDYYYPKTNSQLISKRMKKFFGKLKVKRLISRKENKPVKSDLKNQETRM